MLNSSIKENVKIPGKLLVSNLKQKTNTLIENGKLPAESFIHNEDEKKGSVQFAILKNLFRHFQRKIYFWTNVNDDNFTGTLFVHGFKWIEQIHVKNGMISWLFIWWWPH